MTDAAQNVKDVGNLHTALRESKGLGNFRNVFMYAPGSKKDGIQILPVFEVAAKDVLQYQGQHEQRSRPHRLAHGQGYRDGHGGCALHAEARETLIYSPMTSFGHDPGLRQ